MSCCECYLITEECLRATIPNLSGLTTFAELQSAFRLAHDRDIVPLIGETCADRFCELKQDPPVEGDPDYAEWVLLETMVGKMQSLGSWAIYSKYLEAFPSARAVPTGLVFSNEGPNPVLKSEFEVTDSLKNKARDNYNFYVASFNAWLNSINPDTNEPWRNSYACLPENCVCCAPKTQYNPPKLTSLGCSHNTPYQQLP